MAFPHLLSDYNISSRCINQNVLIDLRSICMQNSSIIEHEKYFVCVYFLAIKVQICNNRIKFQITDLLYARNGEYFSFHLNTKNKFLMSKWHIHRTLNQMCLGKMQVALNCLVPLRHTLSDCLLEDR